jgi:uncharacterized protein (DUF302 family)
MKPGLEQPTGANAMLLRLAGVSGLSGNWPHICRCSCRMENRNVTPIDGRSPTVTFVFERQFEDALKAIRNAFRKDQLLITAELDAAKRIQRALNITVSPCRILLVENPLYMLEATAIDRSSAVFIPLHVVVSSSGACTLVHVASSHDNQLRDFPIGVRIALTSLQNDVLCALGKVADRTRDNTDLADRGSNYSSEPPASEAAGRDIA